MSELVPSGLRSIEAATIGSARPTRRAWLPFALIAAAYLYAFPYFSALRSANEMPRILMTMEMVDRGVFYLDHRMGDMGSTMDTSRAPNGHVYPNKAPGPSFLAVPVYGLLKLLGLKSMTAATWAFRVGVATIPALIFLIYFLRLGRRFAGDDDGAQIGLFAYAFGSQAFPYALLFMSHQPAAVCAGGAFVAAVTLAREAPSRPRFLAATVGFLAALGVMMDYQTVLAALIVGLYVLVRAPRRLGAAVLMSVGAAPVVAALAAYHKICFGGALTTGYTYASDTVTRRGFLGLVGPSWDSFFAVTFEPSNGLFVLAPWTLLAFVGFVLVVVHPERRRAIGLEAGTCLCILLAYLAFLSSLYPTYARAGWCIGPRYMTAAIPFVAWLATPAFSALGRGLLGRVLVLSLVFASTIVFVAGAVTFPHWPEGLRNPVHELVLPLLGNGYAVRSLGTVVGLRGIPSVVPLIVVLLGVALLLFGWRDRRRLVSLVSALGLAVILVGAHRAFPQTGPYAARAYGFAVGIWEPR